MTSPEPGSAQHRALVMGASGFLGSHVVRALVERGQQVRIMVRASSDISMLDGLSVEVVIGDLNDPDSLAAAMLGCDDVYYCIVDTRAWLRDPTPLFETNVEGLRRVLDVACEASLHRFVFTSTFGTLGVNPAGPSTEGDEFDAFDSAPAYVCCRVEAEKLLLSYARERGLPAVACCVGNTYGANDTVPTPHGKMVGDVAMQKMPVYWDGGGPCVGIRDAARGLLLAAEKGRVGERYIIAGPWLDYSELFAIAAAAAGVKPPRRRLPLWFLYVIASCADVVSFFTRKDNRMSVASLRCSTLLPAVDASKAATELGWIPEPIEVEVREAVAFYLGKTPEAKHVG